MTNLIEALNNVENSGRFSTSGKFKSILPGLCIDGIGDIPLPFIKGQAEKIIAKCEQAPFGRGEETITDTSVRNVWQMSPKHVSFKNPEWNQEINKACRKIGEDLGLSDCNIQCELYKVLIYGPGSFFKQHRDTEKMPNMFATMVVNLPSTHEGGELIVSHDNENSEFSFSGKSKFYPEYAAFYADCYHEVKPVLSGYRVSLIYSLAISERKEQPSFSQHLDISRKIDDSISDWTKDNKAFPFLIYLLDYSYTERNLRLSNLKNKDYAKAAVMLNSAKKNDCQAYLCLVSYRRESYGECWGDGYYRNRYKEIDESDFEEYDVSEEEYYAHNLLDSSGHKLTLDRIQLEEDEILAEIPLREGPGREVEISEATGNEGATKDLWYHRGAIILWPKDRNLEVALRSDLTYAIHCMNKSVVKKDFVQGQILAEHILKQSSYHSIEQIRDSLIAIGDFELLNKYICVSAKYGLPDTKEITAILHSFGFEHFEKNLELLINKYDCKYNLNRILSWINQLLFETNQPLGIHPFVNKWMEERWDMCITGCCQGTDCKNLILIFQILSRLNNTKLVDKLITELSLVPFSNFLPSVFTPAIIDTIKSYTKGKDHALILKKLADAYVKLTKRYYSSPPREPETFARKGNVNCECDFCTDVNDFLSKADLKEISFEKTLKRNLIHIEDQISKHQLDLDIKIDKIKNKFRGTVTKNNKSFEQQMEKYTTTTQGKQKVIALIDSIIQASRVKELRYRNSFTRQKAQLENTTTRRPEPSTSIKSSHQQ